MQLHLKATDSRVYQDMNNKNKLLQPGEGILMWRAYIHGGLCYAGNVNMILAVVFCKY